MKIETITVNNIKVAVVSSPDAVITDVQTALDLMMTVKYETGAERIALEKSVLTEEFFILSSGLAGEILQKFVNYHIRLAIYGDFSRYTSKPLRDFIYESNQGKDVFFLDTRETAVEKLAFLP